MAAVADHHANQRDSSSEESGEDLAIWLDEFPNFGQEPERRKSPKSKPSPAEQAAKRQKLGPSPGFPPAASSSERRRRQLTPGLRLRYSRSALNFAPSPRRGVGPALDPLRVPAGQVGADRNLGGRPGAERRHRLLPRLDNYPGIPVEGAGLPNRGPGLRPESTGRVLKIDPSQPITNSTTRSPTAAKSGASPIMF